MLSSLMVTGEAYVPLAQAQVGLVTVDEASPSTETSAHCAAKPQGGWLLTSPTSKSKLCPHLRSLTAGETKAERCAVVHVEALMLRPRRGMAASVSSPSRAEKSHAASGTWMLSTAATTDFLTSALEYRALPFCAVLFASVTWKV